MGVMHLLGCQVPDGHCFEIVVMQCARVVTGSLSADSDLPIVAVWEAVLGKAGTVLHSCSPMVEVHLFDLQPTRHLREVPLQCADADVFMRHPNMLELTSVAELH